MIYIANLLGLLSLLALIHKILWSENFAILNLKEPIAKEGASSTSLYKDYVTAENFYLYKSP
jgi:hypothetical protein